MTLCKSTFIVMILIQARRIALEDAMRLFKFFRECDEFETWMKEKVIIYMLQQ